MARPTPSFLRPAAVLLAAVGALVGLALRTPGWRPGDAAIAASYDSLHTLAAGSIPAATLATGPVAVVYLDLHSHLAEKQDPSQPWPRERHARLIRRLHEAGARAIVFDIVFGGPGPDPAGDQALADALRDCGRVILAGQADAGGRQSTAPGQPAPRWLEIEAPYPPLAGNAAAWGVANHRVDDDFVVRRPLPGIDSQARPSLAWAAAAWLRLPAVQDPASAEAARRGWIRYYGPPLAIPHVSYTQALRPDGVPEAFFRDRIVFVGARPMAGLFLQRQDEFRNPFRPLRTADRFMPGVEVHATGLLNLLRRDWLHRPSPAVEAAGLVGIAVLLGLGIASLRPAPATAAAAVACALVTAGARAAFDRGLWFPWWIVVGAQVPVVLFGSWLFQFRDWFRTRRRLEAERRAADARIREQAALIDKATDAILVRDLDGRVTYANPGARLLYGGRPPQPFAAPEPAPDAGETDWSAAREAVLRDGEWRGEFRHRTAEGRSLVVETRWTLIRDDHGQPRALLTIDTDVTERRQFEAESLRLQRSEAVGSLASGMAHDLKNALAPVLLGTQILSRQTAHEETRRMLSLMEAGTRRGIEMVRQVLGFARGRQEERTSVDLGALARELEALLRETLPRNIALSVGVPPDLWPVEGHPTELHQLLLNLCLNARDALPEGGSLSVALDNVTLGPDEAAAIPGGRPGDFVCLLVADSGTGIPPEILPRIFDPFFTTKPKGAGTGLGLSTSLRILKAHAGFLQVSSTPGEGTSFEIYLPRLAQAAPGEPGSVPEPAPRGHGERLLVVDDDLAILELLRRGLEDHGYRVLTAPGSAEAVATLTAHRAEIALVISDPPRPGLPGSETVDALRRRNPALPWIFLGGDDTEDDARPPAGGSPAEPGSLPELLRRIHHALSAGPPPPT